MKLDEKICSELRRSLSTPVNLSVIDSLVSETRRLYPALFRILELRYVNNLPIRDISIKLNVPLTTVEYQLRKFKQKLIYYNNKAKRAEDN